ncbi:MAG: hypothetical protein AAGD47_16175 [Pseudomonadota bacterium]
MSRLAALAALALVTLAAGCAADQTATPPAPEVTEAAPAAPEPARPATTRPDLFDIAEGPQMTVEIAMTGQKVRDRVTQVGVNCWLDHVVQGAAMFSDERTGRLLIVGETDEIVSADFLSFGEAKSKLRLAGPAVGDTATLNRLLQTLDIAISTGETSCAS